MWRYIDRYGTDHGVQPVVATTYSVRQELGGLLSSCEDRIVYVYTLSAAASGIQSITDTICLGNSISLSSTGGILGTDGTWHWYNGNCGGSPLNTGISITVSPTMFMQYIT